MNDTHRSIATEGHSSNLLGIPTGLLASVSFNDYPIPLSLRGVRKVHADLFDELSQCKNLDQARQTFHRYKDTLFELSNRRNGERRFIASGRKHLTLYRGTNDLRDQQLLQQLDSRSAIVRLNNLLSFTSHRNIADEFGDTIIEVEVPIVKILFFNELRWHWVVCCACCSTAAS